MRLLMTMHALFLAGERNKERWWGEGEKTGRKKNGGRKRLQNDRKEHQRTGLKDQPSVIKGVRWSATWQRKRHTSAHACDATARRSKTQNTSGRARLKQRCVDAYSPAKRQKERGAYAARQRVRGAAKESTRASRRVVPSPASPHPPTPAIRVCAGECVDHEVPSIEWPKETKKAVRQHYRPLLIPTCARHHLLVDEGYR